MLISITWLLSELCQIQARPFETWLDSVDSVQHRNLFNQETSSEEPWFESLAFVVGIAVGFSAMLFLLFIGLCGYCLRQRAQSKEIPKRITEQYEMMSPQNNQSKRSSEGRISFMRSTTKEPSFQAIRHMELDKIELGSSLGRGAFGKVYKGEYAGIPLAIKVFDHDGTVLCQGNEPLETYLSRNTDHPNVVKTLVNETRRRGSFHSCISKASFTKTMSQPSEDSPKIQGLTSSEGSDDEFSYIARAMGGTVDSQDSYQTWVVMEFCEMGSLEEAIRNRRFFHDDDPSLPNLESMLLTAIDIAKAMEYLHDQRIVHGDLKSQNVMLKKSDRDQRGFTCKATPFLFFYEVTNDFPGG